ncbi:redoxin domain-containing protein [Microbulbifer marinus]|uniref:redoxin domain-containing protein n=1 Tax=Microbulbifer marinus TaxID=658218 RepID=UPI0011153851|nr:redoxin domain-containing protein [Microbulbifer marinus]
MAVALLSDSEKGQPVYLAIYNLFVVLVYLFHLSALRHPAMPALDAGFPCLVTADGKNWSAAEHARRGNFDGLLLVFLRSSFCADSRGLLMQLSALLPELKRRGVGLVICSAEPPSRWSRWITAVPLLEFLQLAPGESANDAFLAPGGAPLTQSATFSEAARPSQWLLDSEGFVLWRHLPGNYRTPGSAELLRGQLFRLQD